MVLPDSSAPSDERQGLTPRPYQIEGINWLKAKRRGLLTDVQGLGKTIQAIYAAETPVLVSCPTYLVEQWADVLAEQCPDQRVVAAQGERAKRQKALDARADWTIVNHAMLRTHKMHERFYKTVIYDEAHWFRGRTSLQTRGAIRLAVNTPRVYLLTGTPVMREVDDLWPLLYMIDPLTFRSYWKFVENYCKTVTDQYSTRVVGPKNELLLKKALVPYMLGRTYAEVGLFLPPLIPHDVPLRWPAAKLKAYQTVKKTYRTQELTLNSAIAMMTELRRMTVCEEKLSTCADLVQDVPADSGIVLYCWYRETAEKLAQVFGWPVIDGSIEPSMRAKIAKENPNVIATLASLSEGVDLSAKKTVIFFELDYTPGSIEQSISRLQRWTEKANATDPVNAHYIYLKGTIDETILTCVRRRIHDARRIMSRELA